MKALVGGAALIVVMIGTGLVARTPSATTPRMGAAQLQSDQFPAYVHIDADDWR